MDETGHDRGDLAVVARLLARALPALGAVGDASVVARACADALVRTAALSCRVELVRDGVARVVASAVRPGTGALGFSGATAGAAPSALATPAGHGLVVLPLAVGGLGVGSCTLAVSPEQMDAQQSTSLAEFASALGAVLADCERQCRAVRAADPLQVSLLPSALPTASWFRLAGRYAPASGGVSVGGDWYDAQLIDEETLALSVGDVAGHGVEAAARMGELRAATMALRLVRHSPGGVISVLHRLVSDRSEFATALCMRLHRDGRLEWASAGHPPPVLVRAGAPCEILWRPLSPPLGIGGDVAAATFSAQLRPGDAIVLFTDGLVERRDEPLDLALERLARRLAGLAGAQVDALAARLLADVRVASAPDDVAVLVVRWCPAPAGAPRSASGAQAELRESGPLSERAEHLEHEGRRLHGAELGSQELAVAVELPAC